MRCAIRILPAIVLTLAAAAPALAGADQPIQGYIAGGFSQPVSTADTYLQGGWAISGGMLLRPAHAPHSFALAIDAAYNEWDAKKALLDLGASDNFRTDGGWGSMFSLTVEPRWTFGHPRSVNGYVGIGIGGYRRYVALTQTVLQNGYICDPWWGWCYPGLVPGTAITADDKLTKFGYNATIGMTIPVGAGEMFIEARYHYMITTTATEYVPLSLGYRF
jgi:hypothetical protein